MKEGFLNKMNIAHKEANETEYWLCLLKDSNFVSETDFEFVYQNN
jgi:four helix bundle protein